MESSVAFEKPLLRGVSHQIAFFAAVVAAGGLVARTAPGVARVAIGVFGASLVALFAISALYHRVNWGEVGRQRMRRLDHSAIFILIAGGYTPLFALVPSNAGGHGALIVVWVGAALGVAKSLLWPRAPKWLLAVLCLALGWAVAGQVFERAATLDASVVRPLVVSGCTYSLGAIVYALKRPDPIPRVFGYHEVFHALVVVASVFLYVHVVALLRAVGA